MNVGIQGYISNSSKYLRSAGSHLGTAHCTPLLMLPLISLTVPAVVGAVLAGTGWSGGAGAACSTASVEHLAWSVMIVLHQL